MAYNLEAMRTAAGEAFGSLGETVVANWQVLNTRYFASQLQPAPIQLVETLAYGRGRGNFIYGWTDDAGRHTGRCLVLAALRANNGSLLHEMIHQFIYEVLNEDPRHTSPDWRREIMRLHLTITGQGIWCGAPVLVRQGKKVFRNNLADETGRISLTQKQIAEWPLNMDINLGPLDKTLS